MTTGLSPSSVRWCGSYPSTLLKNVASLLVGDEDRRMAPPTRGGATLAPIQARRDSRTHALGSENERNPDNSTRKAQVSGQASARLTDTYRQRYDSRRARVAQSIFPRAEDARRAGSGRHGHRIGGYSGRLRFLAEGAITLLKTDLSPAPIGRCIPRRGAGARDGDGGIWKRRRTGEPVRGNEAGVTTG